MRLGALRDGALVDRALALGRGALASDAPRLQHLRAAAQRLGVGADKVDQLLDQVGEGRQHRPAVIDKLALGAIAHRPPAVFANQGRGIEPPALVAGAQAEQERQQRLEHGGDAGGVLDPRADIGDPLFQGRELGRGADVPPDLGGVLDAAGRDQLIDQAAVFAERGQIVGQPGARQGVEDGQAVARQPGVLASPERRRATQRQQVGQEIGRLGHQVDAQVLVLDADMDMAAADQHPPPRRAEVGAQFVIARLAGMALAAPLGEGVGRGGDRGIAELGRRRGDARAHPHQIGLGLGHAGVGPGADLDLALQEFRRHLLAQQFVATLEEAGLRLAHQVAAGALDDEVFLLDADGETRAFDHARLPR